MLKIAFPFIFVKKTTGFAKCRAPQLLICDESELELPSGEIFCNSLLESNHRDDIVSEPFFDHNIGRHFFKTVCVSLFVTNSTRANILRLPVTPSIRFHGERGENTVVLFADLNANAFIHMFTAIF